MALLGVVAVVTPAPSVDALTWCVVKSVRFAGTQLDGVAFTDCEPLCVAFPVVPCALAD
jgi:hypothetical protein